MLEAAFVRSTLAHARIKSIDLSAARTAPGVHAVLTFEDFRPLLTQDRLPLELRSGSPAAEYHAVSARQGRSGVCRRGDCGGDRRHAVIWRKTRRRWSRSNTSRCRRCRTAARAIEPGAPRADTRKASNIVKEFRQAYGNVDAAFTVRRTGPRCGSRPIAAWPTRSKAAPCLRTTMRWRIGSPSGIPPRNPMTCAAYSSLCSA